MLSLSSAAKIESQKLHGDGAWLILLEIQIPDVPNIYIVRNNEDIVWNGHTWLAFPFELDDVKEETGGELPSVVLRVSNITRAVQGYIEDSNGGVGSIVVLRVIHSNHLELTSPELQETFSCISTKSDTMWVYFELGMGEAVIKRFPPKRYIKNFCPFKFKGIQCGVLASHPSTSCKRDLTACRSFNNSTRFGGFPSIPQGGIYV